MDRLQTCRAAAEEVSTVRRAGRVSQVIGLVMEAQGPPAEVGEVCEVLGEREDQRLMAEVVGFRGERILLMPLGDTGAISADSRVEATGRSLSVAVSDELLGRVLGGLGQPIDGRGPVAAAEWRPVNAQPPAALERPRIGEPLPLGVRSLDGLLTCGRGQRLGVFSGAGVGKSSLLGMIARHSRAEVNVVALIGERGREVREFLERDLGEEGLARSVIVVATSDRPALERIKGALVAATVAEYFRDQGKHVMLLMDSVTRIAWAQREVGLAIGEPPTRNGYTPSVFAFLPRLLERAGCSPRGSITALYAVLVEGDDLSDPVADAVRSILDGHVVLSRKLAGRGLYPPVDVLESVSRLMPDLTTAEHLAAAQTVRDILGAYAEAEDLVSVGAYVAGSNPRTDRALAHLGAVEKFLAQGLEERAEYEDTVSSLIALAAAAGPAEATAPRTERPAEDGAGSTD